MVGCAPEIAKNYGSMRDFRRPLAAAPTIISGQDFERWMAGARLPPRAVRVALRQWLGSQTGNEMLGQ